MNDQAARITILANEGASPATTESRDYWCVVALDYDKDEAWILDRSSDVSCFDILDGSSGDDNGLMQDWIKPVAPGLYKLDLQPWGHQSFEGEWDTGVDVTKATLLVAFPDRASEPDLCEDEGCPHHGAPHVCTDRFEALADKYADKSDRLLITMTRSMFLGELAAARATLAAEPAVEKDALEDFVLTPKQPTQETIDRMTASINCADVPTSDDPPDRDYDYDMRKAYRAAVATLDRR